METRELGNTCLRISRLGLGLYQIGTLNLQEGQRRADTMLNEALDSGVNFLDSAPCYDNSEDFIGNAVSHRRHEYVLATKCGHVTADSHGEAWTSETIAGNIERSLRRLKTDHLDLVQLHSCSVDVLMKGECIDAVVRAKESGKTRFIGYSGDNEDAAWAIESGAFDTLQTSLSLVDQFSRVSLLGPAEARGMGVIAKRPIGNGVWGVGGMTFSSPDDYVSRAQAMSEMGPLPAAPDSPIVLALGFVLAQQQVDTAIVGTFNPSHSRSNIQAVKSQLPIDGETVSELQRRFDMLGQDWRGIG